jgi:hypothetical protein
MIRLRLAVLLWLFLASGTCAAPFSSNLAHVPDNAALMAASTTQHRDGVWRDDFASGRGAPAILYAPSERPCSLNQARGDSGTEVRSADGRCWLAQFGPGPRDVRAWGAEPGGVDASTAISAALAAGPATGAGLAYNVAGNVTLPDGADLSDITLRQTAAGAETRTLFARDGESVILRNVKIDMNSPGNVGRVGKAAGVYLSAVRFPKLDRVEVYGGGIAFGIAVTDCARAIAVDLYVHDLQWSLPDDPGREQIVGIAFIRCQNVTVVNPRVYNLTGVIGSAPARPYQTDGLGFGGVAGAIVVGGTIDTVGEGTDTAGSLQNSDIWIYGTVYKNIDSHAVKFGSIKNSGAIGVRCYDAGLDCATTGANYTTPKGYGAAHIKFINMQAFNTGSNGRWGNARAFDLSWDRTAGTEPVDIQCINCQAIGGPDRRMKFGFLADPGTTFILINPHASNFGQAAFHDRGHDVPLPTSR